MAKIRLYPKALLVIDMLNDFIKEDGALYCGKTSEDIVLNISDKISQFRKEGSLVIFIMDSHDPEDVEFNLFPRHCVQGSYGAQLISELKTEKGDLIIAKASFDGMFNTNLEYILRQKKIEEVYLTGVCTSICIMETASSLAKHNYRIFVFKDSVADFDQEAHNFALKRISSLYGAKIV